MQAYCMKCRTKREMKDPKSITLKNGKPATQGICPNCGTKLIEFERDDVEIDRCPDCLGIWLDKGELDKLVAKDGKFRHIVRHIDVGQKRTL